MIRHSIERLAECAPVVPPESWAGRKAPVIARLSLARYAAFREIKNGARLYALRPRYLDLIAEGLFDLGPNDLVRVLGRLIGIQRITGLPLDNWNCSGTGSKCVWAGFREDSASTLRAAMIYARWSRRVARAIRMAAA